MSANTVNNSNSKFARWVNTVLVVLIGYALAVLTLQVITAGSQDANAALLPATNTGDPGNAPSIDLSAVAHQISEAHLFGNAATKPAPVKEPTKAPPVETRLNLKLSGVFAYQPSERAMAIISTDNGTDEAFRVGDKIIGQTILKAVYPDHVILDNNGRDEILKLPEVVTPIATRAPTQARTPTNQQVQNTTPVELPQSPGALRDELARNPSMLGRIVAAEPYQENGKLLGYRIIPKQNPEILEAQGIIAGDVITAVNGIELNSQKQGIRALRNAVKAQSLDVTILRDGVQIPVSISLAQ